MQDNSWRELHVSAGVGTRILNGTLRKMCLPFPSIYYQKDQLEDIWTLDMRRFGIGESLPLGKEMRTLASMSDNYKIKLHTMVLISPSGSANLSAVDICLIYSSSFPSFFSVYFQSVLDLIPYDSGYRGRQGLQNPRYSCRC